MRCPWEVERFFVAIGAFEGEEDSQIDRGEEIKMKYERKWSHKSKQKNKCVIQS